MQKSMVLYIFIFLLAVGIISAILPYPIFSNYTNLTSQNMFEINNYHETEMQNQTNNPCRILKLSWQEGIDTLLEKDVNYEIIDLQTLESFSIIRISGINHADVIPASTQDFQTINEIYEQSDRSRYAVLVKLNENTFLPASFCPYLHGFAKDKTTNGHFCLHFKDSKTHGTNKLDDLHQKMVEKSLNDGLKKLKSIA